MRASPHHIDDSDETQEGQEVDDDVLDGSRETFASDDARGLTYSRTSSIHTVAQTVASWTVKSPGLR